MTRTGRAATLLVCATVAGTAAARAEAPADVQVCLAQVEAAKRELAVESQRAARARGALEEASRLCRDGDTEAAAAVIEAVREQAGMAMGK